MQVLWGRAQSTHLVFPHLGPVHRWEARVSTCRSVPEAAGQLLCDAGILEQG